MMPVGAGGGGFLRGRPAKPPSSRGSLPPGPARARAGGEGSGLAGAPGPGAPRAGRWGRRRLSARAGRAGPGSGVRRRGRRPAGSGARGRGPGGDPRAGAPSFAARPFLPSLRLRLPGGEAGGEIGASQLSVRFLRRAAGWGGGGAVRRWPASASRGAGDPACSLLPWCRESAAWAPPRGVPTLETAPLPVPSWCRDPVALGHSLRARVWRAILGVPFSRACEVCARGSPRPARCSEG